MSKHRVIVISIDGFAAFYWRDPEARLPTLRRLAERGAVAAGMETVFPSTTWPTHASLMTGVSPSVHGVVANHILNRGTRVPEEAEVVGRVTGVVTRLNGPGCIPPAEFQAARGDSNRKAP